MKKQTKNKTDLTLGNCLIDREGDIFLAAVDDNNRMRNFIVDGKSGIVFEQTEVFFEQISGKRAEYIKKKINDYRFYFSTRKVEGYRFSWLTLTGQDG